MGEESSIEGSHSRNAQCVVALTQDSFETKTSKGLVIDSLAPPQPLQSPRWPPHSTLQRHYTAAASYHNSGTASSTWR